MPPMIQPVNRNNLYNHVLTKTFQMIDNYIYLYHTDTLIALPMYPESLQDSMEVNFQNTPMLSRSAPIWSYTGSGPRSVQIQLPLHRDMMTQINTSNSKLNIPNLDDEDYVDIMVNQLQSIAVPVYAASEKMVNPPLVAVRFGKSLFCKGVVTGSVTVTQEGAILRNDKYSIINVSFSVSEVDPYHFEDSLEVGDSIIDEILKISNQFLYPDPLKKLISEIIDTMK